jgi:hypothetical protein
MIACNKPKKINKHFILAKWKKATALVLCKEELFFQTDTGETLDSIYPVGEDAACIIAIYFNLPIMKA